MSAEQPSLLRGRLGGVSVAGAIRAGALVGFAHGLVLGAILGAVLAWFAGALAGWERGLTTTYGIGANLLPFGGQGDVLGSVGRLWYLVVAGVSLAGGLVVAVLGALLGGLLAGAYNRARPETALVVEITPREAMPAEPTPVPPGRSAHPGRARPRGRGSAPPAVPDRPTPSRGPRGMR